MKTAGKLFIQRGLSVESFSYQKDSAISPMIEETLKLYIPRYGIQTGSRLMIQLYRWPVLEIPKKVSCRSADVIIKRAYSVIDTIEFSIPDGYSIESLPAAVTRNSSFGKVEYTTRQKDNKILYI